MRRSNIRAWYRVVACITPIAGAACTDINDPNQSSLSAAALRGAFNSVPAGYGELSSSYIGTSVSGVPTAGFWLGGGRDGGMDRGAMMGGGMRGEFLGDAGGFGRGFGHQGPFGGGLRCDGTFNASTSRVECSTETRNGLTVTRSAQYRDAAGALQQAFDTVTTNSVNVQTSVTGTLTYAADDASGDGQGPGRGRGPRRGWGEGRGPGGRLLGDTATILSATTTVDNVSDQTVAGLAKGSTERSVNGASRGQESTVGTSSRGEFTATRVVGDTAKGVVIPVATDGRAYPTAGTVIRGIEASVTYAGEAATTLSRREVVTYDGSATAKVVITENGTTKTCTRPLPRGPLDCS